VTLNPHSSEAELDASGLRRVVLCGSFSRDPEGLVLAHKALLEAGCDVLSPLDPHFVTNVNGFALAAHEVGSEPAQVEQLHLKAIESASFVWLHAPEGYVGPSASLEVGFAHALGVAVFCEVLPTDPVIASMVAVVRSPSDAVALTEGGGGGDPGRPLGALQRYYHNVATERGYADETAQDTMLLLTEEIGELARAVRKELGLLRTGGYDGTDIADELADVQLYLLHLANVVGVELADAVTAKEKKNFQRANSSHLARSA
jgi:NTP pyrophosphatase (non-canonical NTP hydrolase)